MRLADEKKYQTPRDEPRRRTKSSIVLQSFWLNTILKCTRHYHSKIASQLYTYCISDYLFIKCFEFIPVFFFLASHFQTVSFPAVLRMSRKLPIESLLGHHNFSSQASLRSFCVFASLTHKPNRLPRRFYPSCHL